ncbi:glycosyltransferase family A protein [Streptomyces sp. MST-110588]|uniref:glycosyltransferase family 2 protein n=1 Tax=Streptomyces sp. MST-110588 TaxID=2833628 RepID=UPI001F5E22D2|nr:glycosyltransferase family A protein [Streptomyces sp. MST-110588]UNO39351.1 glycosyltransferase family 2 protein [Streptomyces sp. MST-110588]
MPAPDLTVVIPSYQHAGMLDLTLGTLAGQSHRNFKVLVMDDDSQDGTDQVCSRYRDLLDLELHVSTAEPKSPSRARDEGSRLATSPVIAFLDCGILVPSGYVAAHLAFHRAGAGRIGVGMCHGHSPGTEQGDDWARLLARLSVDESTGAIEENREMADVRWRLPALTDLRMPWVWGWSGNLSLERSAYMEAGGFDASRTYGYEDSDLAYRLHIAGKSFHFVQDGWGIHYPHPRKPAEELAAADFAGWWKSYTAHRSLALEVERYSNRNETPGDPVLLHLHRMEELLPYLNALGDGCARLPDVPREAAAGDAPSSLLIGGKVTDAGRFGQVTLFSEAAVSTDSLWSCAGIIIPLPEDSLDLVVVGDVWRWLAHPAAGPRVGLLDMLVSEVRRVARRAVFVHSAGPMPFPGRARVSPEELRRVCAEHGLPYTLISG